MSDDNGPDDGERTVFRPNPGRRRPAGPAPPSATPPPTPGAPDPPRFKPANAPAYGASPAPPQQPAGGGDDWIASRPHAPSGAAPASSLPHALDLRFDDLAATNPNPIMRSAGPLLLLLGRLRVAALRASFASLMEQVAEAVNFFEKDIRAAGVSPEQANVAKYLICATADDIVQNIPTEDRHVWAQYSMLSRFYGERIGGVRFFEELDRLLVDPAANYDVLELQHACLALGFQGLYRSHPAGAATLQTRQRHLYETLRRIRGRATGALSPNWEGQKLPLAQSRFRVPTWAAAGLILFAAFAVFLFLRHGLTQTVETVATETSALHSNARIALQRRLPSPPPRVEESTAQLTQLQRIRAALAPEIQAGAITVDHDGQWVAIRVGNLVLFNSGEAKVLPQFLPVARRIGEIIEKEVGPLRIVGHTDNVALSPANRFQSNFQLSVERARAVAALVKPLLAEPGRLTVDGKGPDSPIASNASADGRAKNRRVEILVTRVD
jgi:type VI secretion system protein ImpK